ncbi:MAG: UDP-N-acetylmuramoyl-L-alanyl-D-glutamate--2,6-diaminopimelate ligase [Bacteroidota bacterium]
MNKNLTPLSKLLEHVEVSKMFQTQYGKMVVTHDIMIGNIQYDSRKVERGDLFVAIRGASLDGNSFLTQTAEQGVKAFVTDRDDAIPDSYCMHNGIVKIVVPDSRAALAQISANAFDHPSKKLTAIGVTGTNGKTTTTHLIKFLLQQSGMKTGMIGTIENVIGDQRLPATHTTPESLELNELFDRMVREKCSAAVMEVSSHALIQHRVDGIDFRVAVFTNLTQDHLDYHQTMDEYYKAKKILFTMLAPDAYAVINTDTQYGMKIYSETAAKKISYGVNANADIRAVDITLSLEGVKFLIEYRGEHTTISSGLVGRFNVYNLLAAYSAGIALEIPGQTIARILSEPVSIAGRFEKMASSKGWIAIVDYAHTPDALEKALDAVQDVMGKPRKGKIITIFGCGGNRDKTKRPKMGAIASTMSDVVIVTSDNPRHEKPESIIDDVMAGIEPGAKILREEDRAVAINKGLELASKGDIILIAGKGHEDYQIIGDQKIHFNDREIVEKFLRLHA